MQTSGSFFSTVTPAFSPTFLTIIARESYIARRTCVDLCMRRSWRFGGSTRRTWNRVAGWPIGSIERRRRLWTASPGLLWISSMKTRSLRWLLRRPRGMRVLRWPGDWHKATRPITGPGAGADGRRRRGRSLRTRTPQNTHGWVHWEMLLGHVFSGKAMVCWTSSVKGAQSHIKPVYRLAKQLRHSPIPCQTNWGSNDPNEPIGDLILTDHLRNQWWIQPCQLGHSTGSFLLWKGDFQNKIK